VLGYAQHSGALPSGFAGEVFSSFVFTSFESKSVEVAPGAAFSSRASVGLEWITAENWYAAGIHKFTYLRK
jgi:hypothetical protein